uniref:Uncharacterized protein n=1 Tax=Picea glauca TaxID=3330 RepID=A0A101LZB3_PICGL|nr:hypothetical protein ABT39_MTgene4978 [Picea glauca]
MANEMEGKELKKKTPKGGSSEVSFRPGRGAWPYLLSHCLHRTFSQQG